MAPSSNERGIRLALPLVRLLGAYLPLSLARWAYRRSTRRLRLEAGVTREAVSADGVPCEWLTPPGDPPEQALVYLHGGGFVHGVTSLHLQMAADLARRMGVRALVVDYRLSPEHPFPAALDDCLTVWRWLLRGGRAARNVTVAGDSSGGNLAITSAMKLRDEGSPLPTALACISPVADQREKAGMGDGYRDPLLHPRSIRFYNASYLAGHDPRDPLVSPVFGDWHGLPPLLVHAGEDEMLRGDALQIETQAKAAGVDVRLQLYPRMWHDFQLYRSLPQSAQSLDDIARFLGSHLG